MRRPTHFLAPLLRRSHHHLALRNGRNGRPLAASLEPAFESASRRRGLLGREGIPDGTALIIAPCAAVHTVGMQFPIDVVFANRMGRVLKIMNRVRPWRIAAALRAFAAIELPAGSVERSGTQTGDVLEIAE